MVTEEVRQQNYAKLEALGFRPARWLPIDRELKDVRTPQEIAHRLLALDAVFTWAAYTEDGASSTRLLNYIQRSQLQEWMTPQELEVLALDRTQAKAEFGDLIGWRLENMWPLAWALGFQPVPDVAGTMISEEVIHPMVYDFLPGLDNDVQMLLAKAVPRSSAEIEELEDLSYCVHNAARSAQLGRETAPDGFHPVVNGGVIHERRHALTWMCSPQVSWDATDLST